MGKPAKTSKSHFPTFVRLYKGLGAWLIDNPLLFNLCASIGLTWHQYPPPE